MKFRKLKADEIDVKVGNVTGSGYTLLLYKNARVDMAILDETVGCDKWQRDHKEVKGNLYCGIGINFPIVEADTGKPVLMDRWVWKWDCGVESAFGDKEKGEASDSFKRAGFNWGIGRELYTSPFIFVNANTNYDENKKCYKISDKSEQKRSQKMRVKEIEYNEKDEISKLIIIDNNDVQVYPKQFDGENKPAFGGKYVFTSGSFKGKTIEQADAEDKEYLDKLLAYDKLDDNIRKNIEAYRKLKQDISL